MLSLLKALLNPASSSHTRRWKNYRQKFMRNYSRLPAIEEEDGSVDVKNRMNFGNDVSEHVNDDDEDDNTDDDSDDDDRDHADKTTRNAKLTMLTRIENQQIKKSSVITVTAIFSTLPGVTCLGNLALGRPATSSSTLGSNVPCDPDKLVDGDANPTLTAGHCFHSNDPAGGPNWAVVDLVSDYYVDVVNLFSRDCNVARLDNFIIGLTSVNYFPNGSEVVRGSYPLCGQYKYKAVVSSKLTLKCYANLPSYRYVIAQQPISGTGWFTICELEVYAAKNPNGKMRCLIGCLPGQCDSINFSGTVCELNTHLRGYNRSYLKVNTSPGWSFYEVQYV
ncbi:hypothetical protein HELRODRAFT_163568 [Helobdella robusta]|uniref:Fucolectin tachylectin-4 pentraxin-1 domain-containing protein n=1 Tax=Helobdella robusta TaxID=6412 RepID=T1EU79_HELRO|nr:hypothetical protein HELRODRAFT_163568 [Helobdella robusta]ESN96499.1 hypothetical protein HELRODRAFT_163568 [Helobdella robusta]